MRVIFLDIDGVLCTMESLKEPFLYVGAHDRHQRFDKVCVSRLNKFCKQTGAKLVISSCWRLGRTVGQLKQIFKAEGVEAEIIGKTPYIITTNYKEFRGAEILSWIDSHRKKYGEIDYVVIDDDRNDIIDYIPKDKFIYIRNGLNYRGLLTRHFRKMKHWLS